MLSFSPTMRIIIARDDVSFIGGIDHLAAVCRRVLGQDPMTGAAFVFRNRRRTMVRILYYDGQGFLLVAKRLSTGRFRFWSSTTREIAARELAVLLWAGDPTAAKFAEDWRSVKPSSSSATEVSNSTPRD